MDQNNDLNAFRSIKIGNVRKAIMMNRIINWLASIQRNQVWISENKLLNSTLILYGLSVIFYTYS